MDLDGLFDGRLDVIIHRVLRKEDFDWEGSPRDAKHGHIACMQAMRWLADTPWGGKYRKRWRTWWSP
jgi:hypothetical protein